MPNAFYFSGSQESGPSMRSLVLGFNQDRIEIDSRKLSLVITQMRSQGRITQGNQTDSFSEAIERLKLGVVNTPSAMRADHTCSTLSDNPTPNHNTSEEHPKKDRPEVRTHSRL